MKTNDKGNSYIKTCILEALLTLMDEKPFQAITVSEITRRAGVSRMAYYRNYASKEDILTAKIRDMVHQYGMFSQLTPGTHHHITHKNIAGLFVHCKEQETFILKCADAGLSHHILEAITDFLLTYFDNAQQKHVRQYILNAYASALYATIMKWLRSGAKETPEELAEILYNIFGAHV